MANPHLAAGRELIGPAPAAASLVVVAVHGRGQSPAYMVEHFVERLRTSGDDIAWLLPVAAENCWYPNSFLAPIDDNQPDLDHALAAIAAVADELDGVDPAGVVWAGFSQGACLVSEFVARRPRRWGGVLVLTGGMIGPPGTALTVAGPLDGVPAYFGVGDADGWVPAWRVEETAAAYRAAGADVTVDVFPDRPHEISAAEIDRAREMIAAAAGGMP